MPYTRTRAQLLAHPPGTEQAKNIDDAIRQDNADWDERFQTIITDVTADPWVIKPSISGLKTGKKLWVPPHAFRSKDQPAIEGTGYVEYLRSQDAARAGVSFMAGVKITLIEVYADRNTCPSADWSFIRQRLTNADPSALTTVVLASGATAGAGIRKMSSAALAETVTEDDWYEVAVDSVGTEITQSLKIYGARITYDVTDAQQHV